MASVGRGIAFMLLAIGAGCVGDQRLTHGPQEPEQSAEAQLATDSESLIHVDPVRAGYAAYCSSDSDCDDHNPCNGVERCGAYGCDPGAPLADGDRCERGGYPFEVDICRAGACVKAQCGDGIVTLDYGEECDDGNALADDGCDQCQWTCESDADCSSGLECASAGVCNLATHRCEEPTPELDGVLCAEGGGECEAGVCLLDFCEDDEVCQDASLCNGVEQCSADGCLRGEPLDCDDEDACTWDRCDSAGGCEHGLLDADSDGQASWDLGSCGLDCDDSREDVFDGAPELCDGRDNDCDGDVDEGARDAWYVDCDQDGFAAPGARVVTQCGPPAASVSGCPHGAGGWTSMAPMLGSLGDCNDANPLVHPAQGAFQFQSIPGASYRSRFDYDCNGIAEPLFDEPVGECIATGYGCQFVAGWMTESPACGEASFMIAGCQHGVIHGQSMCVPIPDATLRTQRCR